MASKKATQRQDEPGHPDATTLVASLRMRPHVQVMTQEGLKPAFACVAEDGSRAIVIALDPISKYSVEDRPGKEALEQLFWLKGEDADGK